MAVSQSQSEYGDYYFNPNVYNPSFTGSNRLLEFTLTHKKQWVGIEGAPVNSTLNIQIPTRTKMSFGISLITDKSVMVRNTTFYSTCAYMVPLGKNHYFQFGLSGGVALEGMSTDNLNTQDPAILQAAQHKVQWVGQAGIHYRKDQLILGLSIPGYQFTIPLTERMRTDQEYFKWSHRMSMLILTGQYRLPLAPSKIDFEPVIIYRLIVQSSDQVQIGGIMHFQNIFWVGTSYRQNNGLSVMTGLKIKKKVKIGYAYSMGATTKSGYLPNSHEFQINFTTGKIKKIRR